MTQKSKKIKVFLDSSEYKRDNNGIGTKPIPKVVDEPYYRPSYMTYGFSQTTSGNYGVYQVSAT